MPPGSLSTLAVMKPGPENRQKRHQPVLDQRKIRRPADQRPGDVMIAAHRVSHRGYAVQGSRGKLWTQIPARKGFRPVSGGVAGWW